MEAGMGKAGSSGLTSDRLGDAEWQEVGAELSVGTTVLKDVSPST